MDRVDSIDITEPTADFYYTDIEKVEAFTMSKLLYGSNYGFDVQLFDDLTIYNPLNLTYEYTQDDSLISLFSSVEESEMRDFLDNPLAWKNYSSQTFRYKAAKGNWTLLITNNNENIGARLTYAKVIMNVAKPYTCHEGCELCLDVNGCAGDCIDGYDFYNSDFCHKKIDHCEEQEADECILCEQPDYWQGWNWKFCTQCDKNCEVCDQDTLDCYSCRDGFWVDYKTKKCKDTWPEDLACSSFEECFEMTKQCAAVQRECEGLYGEEFDECWMEYIEPFTDPES